MINFFTFGQVSDFLIEDFRTFKFGSKSLTIRGKKVGREGLSYLCLYLHHMLFYRCKSPNSNFDISPACHWASLTYFELFNLLPVLITDIYELLNRCPPSHLMSAYVLSIPHSRFTTFIKPSKVDMDLVINSYHRYIFNGEEFSSVEELKEAVDYKYPSSKYNINLIIN